MGKKPRQQRASKPQPAAQVSHPDAQPSRRILAAILVAATLAVYLQVAGHPFIGLDDASYVSDNPEVRRGLTLHGLRWALTATSQFNWHPLTWVSHMADVSLFGMHPGAHHLVSLALHLANALLLLGLLRRATGDPLRSAFVAGVFALHPLHVESVAWIAERKDLLSTCFGLLALLAYLRYCRAPRWSTYLPVPLLHAASLAAKPMLVTLPLLLLLLDWWPLGRPAVGARARASAAPPRSRLLLEKLPLLALSCSAALLAFVTQRAGRSLVDWEHFPLWVRAANAALSTATYAAKTLIPYPLAVFYPHPGRGISLGLAAVAAVLLAAATAVAIRRRASLPALLAGWLWYLLLLSPVIGLIQAGSQAMADRYAYLSQTGLAVIAAWGLPRAATATARRWQAITAVASLACFAVLTAWQVRLWRSDLELFGHAAAHTRRNYLAYNEIGRGLSLAGRPREAAAEIRRALEFRPAYPLARYNLGVVMEQLGEPREAQRAYEEAIRLKPGYAEAHTNLGSLLHREGRLAEAEGHYREALRANPADAVARTNLGLLAAAGGRLTEAEADFVAALEADPAYRPAAEQLARVRAALRGAPSPRLR